jgi:hypothetical protein
MTLETASDNGGRKPAAPNESGTAADAEYKVGPGRPPKEHQFKPGQSGNPKGRKPRAPSAALDLKDALERLLNKPVTLKQGEKERTVTMAVAAMEQWVAQFAKGDRHARRDLLALADKLGVDLVAGQRKAVEEALASDHQAILDAYVARRSQPLPPSGSSRVFASPELLDDDIQEE